MKTSTRDGESRVEVHSWWWFGCLFTVVEGKFTSFLLVICMNRIWIRNAIQRWIVTSPWQIVRIWGWLNHASTNKQESQVKLLCRWDGWGWGWFMGITTRRWKISMGMVFRRSKDKDLFADGIIVCWSLNSLSVADAAAWGLNWNVILNSGLKNSSRLKIWYNLMVAPEFLSYSHQVLFLWLLLMVIGWSNNRINSACVFWFYGPRAWSLVIKRRKYFRDRPGGVTDRGKKENSINVCNQSYWSAR